jgi:hypothetical protein
MNGIENFSHPLSIHTSTRELQLMWRKKYDFSLKHGPWILDTRYTAQVHTYEATSLFGFFF